MYEVDLTCVWSWYEVESQPNSVVSSQIRKKTKKNMFLIFSDMMQWFIFIFMMVLIIEEVIVYNFHTKYLEFWKKKTRKKTKN